MNRVKTGLLTFGAASGLLVAAANPNFALNAAFAEDVTEQDRDVGTFDSVNLKGSMDVHLEQGDTHAVRVVADGRIIDEIETYVDDGTLVIRREKEARWSGMRIERLDVYVTGPGFEVLRLQGSGDMMLDGLEQDDLGLVLQGSGDIVVEDADIKTAEIRLQGSGDIEVGGTCTSVSVRIQGSGDVEAGDLECESADVTIQGSGDAEVYASGRAVASVRGSGGIVIEGDPDEVDKSVRGSGEIEVS